MDSIDHDKNVANAINDICQDIHTHNAEVGWYDGSERYSDPDTGIPDKYYIPTKLCLAHSEISEAMEGFRKGLKDDHLPHHDMFAVELADACIRIFDLAGYFDIPLGDIIQEKRGYNKHREDHKREVRAASAGKSF